MSGGNSFVLNFDSNSEEVSSGPFKMLDHDWIEFIFLQGKGFCRNVLVNISKRSLFFRLDCLLVFIEDDLNPVISKSIKSVSSGDRSSEESR